MTTDLIVRYPDQTDPVDTDWPVGEPKNITSPTQRDGTPWEQAVIKDLMANIYGVLNSTGVVPDDVPDTALVSQYMGALTTLISIADFYVVTGAINTLALTAVNAAVAGPDKRFNPATIKDGMRSRCIPLADNSGPATANHGALGAIPIVFKGVALTGGELVGGVLATLVYDEANNWHELESLSKLTDLFDVTDQVYTNGQVPTFDSVSGKFIAQNPPSGDALNGVLRADIGYGALKGGVDGDLLIQWGFISVPADTTTTAVTLPIAFAGAGAYGVSTVYSSVGTGEQDNWAINGKAAGGFNITNGQNQILTYYWVAIGYE